MSLGLITVTQIMQMIELAKLFCDVKTYEWSSRTFCASSFCVFIFYAILFSSVAWLLFLRVQYGQFLFLPQRQSKDTNASVDETSTARIAVLKVRSSALFNICTNHMLLNCLLCTYSVSIIEEFKFI